MFSASVKLVRSPVGLSPCYRGLLSLGRCRPHRKGSLCMSSRSEMDRPCGSPAKIAEPFFRRAISSMEKIYLNRNPTANAILDLVRSYDGDNIFYDHFAFRTFGVDGHGIDSMAKLFVDFGYTPRDELRFPAKKLRALWFAPPATKDTGIQGPLPRIFISELIVEEMSREIQETIRNYTKTSGCGGDYAALASAMGSLTWDRPFYSDYQRLLRESEYAAWTLVNGYALNHVTISTHRLKSNIREIDTLNQFIQENGYKLNSEGGTLKVSPDGLLRQSSTVADSTAFTFAEGVNETVPCSYIEFAERLLLPQFKNLPAEEAEERHRRDGFEVGNADKIFESTSNDQLKRSAA
ncbi:unnamed protein product [Spirodela intermedia]|uniref:2-oxoadipate dioxygenase/decarboxylase n=2 Tax=Spirodela intermedia TaxID=51605 RepID=A0A7I8J841_SPIIN|nr:unnamed protein product [Spirodela intermedia]CAA6666220.1 unnamed protein product [Spirodela intermedia]CAA7402997.1 unnamed protein product [Spirodela intermedia]